MLRKLKLAAALIALSGAASTTAYAETLQGTVRGRDTPRLSSESGARLLRSFHISFVGTDHHLMTIAAMPNRPDKDQALIVYSDNNSDDQFSYDVSFTPYSGPIYQNFAHQSSCRGSCTIGIPTPPDLAGQVFVIKGCSVNFIGMDHHIDEFQILENNGELTVKLNDQNDDDQFAFDVTYAYIPRSQFSVVSNMKGAVRRVGGGQINPGTAVIRGFAFDFRSVDHHVTDIGVVMPGDGNLKAHYSDKNGDDQFYYTVEYAIIGP